MKRIVLSACAISLAAVGVALSGAVAGAASSSPSFNGQCSFTGVASFFDPATGTANVLTGTPTHLGYSFVSGAPGVNQTSMQTDPDTTECKGTLNGQTVDVKAPAAQASVKGAGELSCAAGGDQAPTDPNNDPPGQGYLQLTVDGKTYQFPFLFTFGAAGTTVLFTTDNSKLGGGTQPGEASFARYAPPSTPSACGPGGSGVSKLGFAAMDLGGPSAPFVGSCVAGCVSGASTSTTTSQTTTTTSPTTTTTTTSSPSGVTRSGHKPSKPKSSARARCVKRANKIKSKKKRQAALKRCSRLSKQKHG